MLRTVPQQVIGPGHNSIATGPDNETEYVIYHAWDKDLTKRRMFIDPLLWTPDGPRCDGPSVGPRVFNEWHDVHPEVPGIRHGATE